MTGASFNLKKFICKEVDQSESDSLDENLFEDETHPLFPRHEDYDDLKDSLKRGDKDRAKYLIEKGCCLDKYGSNDNTYDGSPLHLAVSLEYSDIVNLLLEKGASTDSTNYFRETPLILAAIVGNSQIISMILSKMKAQTKWNSSQIFTDFHIACMQNNVDLVKKFLVFEIDINKPVCENSLFWPGYTPLHFAVEFKCNETVKFLVESGADITIQDNRGITPLHLAFRKRNRMMVDILLSVQYFFTSNPIDSDGLSHFHIACAMNKREIVEDFLEKKINVRNNGSQSGRPYNGIEFAINNQCIDVLKYLLECNDFTVDRRIMDCAYKSQNENILNMIISSIEKKMVSIQCPPRSINFRLKKKVVLNVMDKINHLKRFSVSQYLELHVAVLQKNEDKTNSILEVHHPRIITLTDVRGKTALHLAFESNQTELVIRLSYLHLELNDNPVDSGGLSHFHICCTTRNSLIVKDFIKKGVNVNKPVNLNSLIWAGYTPLHFAIVHCQENTVKLLLDNGADFTLENASKISAYDLAIPYFGCLLLWNDELLWEIIEYILIAKEHRQIDNFENRGITLLHAASAINDVDRIQRYATAETINKTISKNIINFAGFTSLHLAAYYNHTDAVKALLDYGADPGIQNDDKSTAAHLLMSPGMDERLLLTSKIIYNSEGISTFHVACASENTRAVQHLLKMGADIHKRVRHPCFAINTYDGKTPLHLAAATKNVEIVELLLEHGANVNARDCYFATPLHYCRDKVIMEMLLARGADPEALDLAFDTVPESMIQISCSSDLMTAAIESGLDINKTCDWDFCKQNIESMDESTLTVLARHIERLTVLGVDLNGESMDLYNFIITKHSKIRLGTARFKSNCEIELSLMKEIKIDNLTSLYNILFKSLRELVIYSKNETFRKIVEAEQTLRQTYPIYAYLVILQFKKGLKRTALINDGKTSLGSLMKRWMGDLVLEMILELLNDYEIKYLIYAASGQNIFQ